MSRVANSKQQQQRTDVVAIFVELSQRLDQGIVQLQTPTNKAMRRETTANLTAGRGGGGDGDLERAADPCRNRWNNREQVRETRRSSAITHKQCACDCGLRNVVQFVGQIWQLLLSALKTGGNCTDRQPRCRSTAGARTSQSAQPSCRHPLRSCSLQLPRSGANLRVQKHEAVSLSCAHRFQSDAVRERIPSGRA